MPLIPAILFARAERYLELASVFAYRDDAKEGVELSRTSDGINEVVFTDLVLLDRAKDAFVGVCIPELKAMVDFSGCPEFWRADGFSAVVHSWIWDRGRIEEPSSFRLSLTRLGATGASSDVGSGGLIEG